LELLDGRKTRISHSLFDGDIDAYKDSNIPCSGSRNSLKSSKKFPVASKKSVHPQLWIPFIRSAGFQGVAPVGAAREAASARDAKAAGIDYQAS
jgi:hypothetical protein